ncbi:MAG: OmpA family protein [Pseudoxanthomonas sp.]
MPLLPFDTDSLPLSTRALGDLPFFSLPSGYGPVNEPTRRAFARFPFRLGEGVHWVEGASWNGLIGIDREHRRDKEYSQLELRRNVEAVLAQAGAQQVFEGSLDRNIYYGPQLKDEIGTGFIEGVNLDAGAPTTVHVIRQADRNIWVQLSTDERQAAMVVVEERPFKASAHWTGKFPYLTLPAGYEPRNSPRQRDFDMFPFWTGQAFEQVEGRTYETDAGRAEREYSVHEVRRNLEAMMDEAGGTLVFDGRIPKAASDGVDAAVKRNYGNATGSNWDEYDIRVYRVDRADGKQVWVFARLYYRGAGFVVVERQGFVQTAALLPADALKRQLDADGRVTIQVNFAVDKADILPESQPQIEQVLALLRAHPQLALSVEGHTDNTGGVDHNRRLSEARAQSVMAALVGQGIDATRLSAAGFGQDSPIADNGNEEGRAKNRRVELVKRL